MPNLIVTNNERAAIGEKAVLAVFRDDIESGGIDLGTGIYDLVADLLHLARENDIEPDYIIHMAQMHFELRWRRRRALMRIYHMRTPITSLSSVLRRTERRHSYDRMSRPQRLV